MRPRRSLRYKLFGAILLATLGPLLVASWAVAANTETRLRAEALGEAATAGRLAQKIVEERGQRLVASAQAIALIPLVREAAARRDRAALLELTRPQMERLGGPTVAVVGDEGTVIARAWSPDQYGDNAGAALKGLQQALRGQAGYSTEAAGLRGFALRGFSPIDLQGHIVGAVVVTQNLDQEFLTALRETTGFAALAILPDGSTAGAPLDPAAVRAIRASGQHFAGLATVGGREQAIFAWGLADPDGEARGFLGIVHPLDDLETAQAEVRRTAVTAALLALLGAVALALLLSHVLIAPLQRIARAARAIARGEVQELPRLGGGGELDDLSHSLASMLAALRQADQARSQLAAIVESSGDAILGTTLDGVVTSWNPAAERLYGYAAAEVLGQSITRLVPPDRAGEVPGILERVSRGENVEHFETVRLRKDGRPIDVSVSVSPVRDAAGTIVGAGTIARDISERRHAEDERRRLGASIEHERATLAAVMASMSDGLVVMDPARRVRYCNAQAGALLGVDSPTLVGQSADDLFATRPQTLVDPRAARAAQARALARLHEQPSFEVTFAGPPRRDVLLEYFLVADDLEYFLGADDLAAHRGCGLILRDVTRERDLQRTKDELVSVVSHELRTPLASLVGFAELLLTRDFGEAQRREFLTVMLQEGRRLTALINDFLDLQRMESGRQQIAPEPTDLGPLLARAMAAAGEDPQRPIRLDTPDDLPPVLVDADRIQQVLANLLSNARKYSPAGGPVRLEAAAADGQVQVVVSDRGLGLPPEAVPRLFEKFYRVDNSDRRAITGTGLGLAICRNIVEAHGGHIWAESAGLGHGARFGFTLPLAQRGAARGEVLIVEDDAGFARLLEAELAAVDLTAVRAASGEAALAQFAAVPPRAVVLDLKLPGMPGEAFLRWLRQPGRVRVPVVVVTVEHLDEAARRALADLWVAAVLQKGPGVAPAAAGAVARLLRTEDAAAATAAGAQEPVLEMGEAAYRGWPH